MSSKWFLVCVLAFCILRNCDADSEPTITRLINTGFSIGSPAVLECAIENAEGYNVYWVKINADGDRDVISFDDAVLIRDPRFSVSYDNETTAYFLMIDSLTEEDRGTYRCEVVVPGGKTVEAGDIEVKTEGQKSMEPEIEDKSEEKIILEFDEPTTEPRINQITHDQILDEGENMIISCSVENADVGQLSWSKEESGTQMPVTVGTDVQVDNPRLSIRHDSVSNAYTMLITNIRQSDAGKYLCSVTSATTSEILSSRQTTVEVNPSLVAPDYSNPAQAAHGADVPRYPEAAETATEITTDLEMINPSQPVYPSTSPRYANVDQDSDPTADRGESMPQMPDHVQPDSYPQQSIPQTNKQSAPQIPDYPQYYPERRSQNVPEYGQPSNYPTQPQVPDYVRSSYYPNVDAHRGGSQAPDYGYSNNYPREERNENEYQHPYYAQPNVDRTQGGSQAPDYSQSNSYPEVDRRQSDPRNVEDAYAPEWQGGMNPGMSPEVEYISPTQNAERGRAVILECNVRNAEDYAVLWTKDGRALTTEDTLLINDPRYAIRHDMARQSYTLDINDLRDADAGVYKCEIQIPFANSVIKDVQLIIGNQNYQDIPAIPETPAPQPAAPKKPCCGSENVDFTEEFTNKLSENIMNRVIPKLRNLQEEHREMQRLVSQLESDYMNIKQQLRVLRKREGRSPRQ